MSIEQLSELRARDYWEFFGRMKKCREQSDELFKLYQFQENGGKVELTEDGSWKEGKKLYKKPELLLNFGKQSTEINHVQAPTISNKNKSL